MVRKALTEILRFARVPPIALLLIGWVVLWAVLASEVTSDETSCKADAPVLRPDLVL